MTLLLFGKFLLLSLRKITVYKAIIQKTKSSKDNVLNFRKTRREKQLLQLLKISKACEMSRCFKDQKNISDLYK